MEVPESETLQENEQSHSTSEPGTNEDVPEEVEEGNQDLEHKLQRLNLMLQQATVYSQFISQRIRLPGEVAPPQEGMSPSGQEPDATERKNGRRASKRPRSSCADQGATEGGEKKDSQEEGEKNSNGSKTKKRKTEASIGQPEMLTGGALRDYQLTGVAWLASLYENGINGILADEMGLGKTIQTVAFLTYLCGKGVRGPFLVVGPLSTLSNWVKEVEKWAPTMPVLLYHGSKEERAELRRKKLAAIVSNKNGVVVTSFEITMKDRSALQRKRWKYIILDEGHRIKNMNCRLVRDLKTYDSANRLLLTGTPLQNNLTELWSLLSFLMPNIFDDLDAFQKWFNFEGVGREEGNRRILTAERENQLVTKLHTILKPFLLRRVKTDVEMDLPKKEERIINTVLTPTQHKYYQAIMNKQLRQVLATSPAKVQCQGTGLQNLLMQLRKCCNHPYLFEWPVDDKGEEVIDERLVEVSGKLQMLDRLLPRLHQEGHKVLLFSQMTRMLDILEDYLYLRQLPFFRIDGSTAQPERQAQIDQFNSDPATFCFLLSTRAGGLGINLTAANVVIFVDSDWNPQMDLQAQDRAHRIGQTRNVRVYRLVTGNSIESKIVERAAHKLKLGALVLAGAAKQTFQLDELSDLLDDSSLEQPLSEPLPTTDDLLFNWD